MRTVSWFWCVLLLSSLARGEVISTNFNPDNSVGSSYLINNPDAIVVSRAASFLAPIVPGDPSGFWKLTSAELVVGVDGDGPLTFTLHADNDGVPGGEMVSSTLVGVPEGFEDAAVVEVLFPTQPLLSPGNLYWFSLSAGGTEFTRAYWRENTTGQFGSTAVSFDAGVSWSADGNDPPNETPTLQVNALAIPEPGTLALMGIAALFLAFRYRRR